MFFANAQTNVSGIISSNTTWDLAGSPYIVTGSILLDSSFTLTIDAGVTVKFNAGTSIQIGGILRAIGTTSLPITFTSNSGTPAAGDWGYILFNNKSTDYDTVNTTGCIMQYCIVEYGGGGVNAALSSSNAFPFFDNCEVRNNASSGIYGFYDFGQPDGVLKITNCSVHDNTSTSNGGGVNVNLGQWVANDLHIFNCKFYNNTALAGGAIYVADAIANNIIKLYNNEIYNNTANTGNGGGVFITTLNNNGTYSTIWNNIFYNNSSAADGGGMAITTSSWGSTRGLIKNNIFYNNTAVMNGGGLREEGVATINNIFAGNSAGALYGAYYCASFGDQFMNNHVIDNSADDRIASFSNDVGTYTYNTITRNTTTGTSPTRAVDMGGSNNCSAQANCQRNNLYGNVATYQFYNTRPSGCDIDVKNSWWGTNNIATINNNIYDFLDNNTVSIAYYSPFLTSPEVDAPVTPPVDVIKTDLGGGSIQVSWTANPETDLAGYNIYWGFATGYSFANSTDAGNVTSFTITASMTDTIAITAYDAQANGTDDQVEGHESWYTYATGKVVPAFSAMPIPVCTGDTVYFSNTTAAPVYPYSNTTYSWTFAGGTPSVSSAENPKVLYYNSGTYSAKLVISNIAGSDSVTMTNYIVVDTLPNPAITSSDTTTFCQGDSVQLDAGSGYLSYQWSGTSSATTQTIYAATSGSYSVSVGNNCGNSTTNISVTVNPLPSVTFTLAMDTVCENDGAITLSGGSPAGGIYSGTGVSAGDFNPGTAGAGTHTLVYDYTDVNGCSNSDSADVVVDLCSGIKINNEENIVLYPNPASQNITIRLAANAEFAYVALYDVLGNMVMSEKINGDVVQLNCSKLPAGVYFVELRTENKKVRKKVVLE